MTQEEIMKRIVAFSEALGFDVNSNIQNIARLKAKMEDYRRCPCNPKDENMYCGSKKCEEMTKKNGHCCCNLFIEKSK